jgi:5-methyltetrahydrofolate--homocysteine methyltransferase
VDLNARLNGGELLILDGAMGTQLEERGKPGGGSVTLSSPETVKQVHEAYAAAGAQAIITNTLTMNRVYLETHGGDAPVAEANQSAAEIARVVADSPGKPPLYVLGNMGSTGQMLEPYGTYTVAQFEEAYREQAEALSAGNVDGFFIETMFDLGETLCAIRACKAVSDLPILVSMTFTTTSNGGRTMMGNSAADCATAFAEAGVAVVGTNCGDLSPEEMAEVVGFFREVTDLPILVEPNAGKPKLVGDKTVYDMEPGAFADGVGACVDAGATLIGGCCGTTPEHIAELSRRFAGD